MNLDSPLPGGEHAVFRSTCWSVVRQAKDGSREALDRLMEVYWRPIYFYIRRHGHDRESAKDLTQGFIGSLLERDFFQAVTADKGRFRSYLLGALTHFLSDAYDRSKALKRGGHLNFVRAEAELASAAPTPEEAFRQRWAREILARAMGRLRGGISSDDLALLAGQPRPDLSVTERKHRLFRLRARLRDALRDELLDSVERPEELDSEIRELFSALS